MSSSALKKSGQTVPDEPIAQENHLFVMWNGEPRHASIEDLFDARGFGERASLRAVTFVSSPSVIERVAADFYDVEVIVGIDKVEPLAAIRDKFTYSAINAFNELNPAVKDAIADGRVRVRYSNGEAPIHSKIYVLSSGDGSRTRVMIGSANLTFTGLGEGRPQYEELCVFDDNEAYFDSYMLRYRSIAEKTLSYYPPKAVREWKEARKCVGPTQDKEIKAILIDEIKEIPEMRDLFESELGHYEDLASSISMDRTALSKNETSLVEIYKRLSKPSSGKMRNGKALETALASVVKKELPKLTVVSIQEEDADISVVRPRIHGLEDPRSVALYIEGKGGKASRYDAEASLDDLCAGLDNLERFIETYGTYACNTVGDEYLASILDIVLYALASPRIWQFRQLVSPSQKSKTVHLYCVIGGVSDSGKTHVLRYLFKMLTGRELPEGQVTQLSLSKIMGSNFRKSFNDPTRMPLFVDDAKPSMFSSQTGAQHIRDVSNTDRRITADAQYELEYGPLICTTNADKYSPAEGVPARVMYVPLNQVLDTSSVEGSREIETILAEESDALGRHIVRMIGEVLAECDDPLLGEGDVLAIPRLCLGRVYEQCGRERPSWFAAKSQNNAMIDGQRKWRVVFEDRQDEAFFIAGKNELRVNLPMLFPAMNPTRAQLGEYANSLPGYAVVSREGNYYTLNRDRFFDWIGVKDPWLSPIDRVRRWFGV